MILADKIIEERKKNGWSQEELAARLSVSRQSVSKWESAQSTPDLQRILLMAELFGCTTDYLLKDEIEEFAPSAAEAAKSEIVASQAGAFSQEQEIHYVSLEEANAFLEQKLVTARKVASGVLLCILSPTLLIFLAGLSEGSPIAISENAAAGIGLAFLFGAVALAVYTFVTCSMKEERYKYMEKEAIETAYGVTGMVREKKEAFEAEYIRAISAGIVLCIIAALPLILVATLVEFPDYVYTSLTALLLVIVAIGVYMIVRACIIRESHETLLQEGEFTAREKELKKHMDLIDAIYWCLATAIYLGWSFYTFRWDFTWIIWPVAAVFYGAIQALVKIFHR